MDMTKPISPTEIAQAKVATIPGFVFESINELLAAKFSGGSCTITQKEIVNAILAKDMTLTSNDVYNRGYLNFEEAYRQTGWFVVYDKPAYNESYDAYFKFSSNVNRGGV